MVCREIHDQTILQPIINEQAFPEFLQSWAWKELQESMGYSAWVIGFYHEECFIGYALVVEHSLPGYQCFVSCSRGPVFSASASQEDKERIYRCLFDYCRGKSRGKKFLFLRIEPAETPVFSVASQQCGLPIVCVPHIQPQETLILNLQPSVEDLWSKLSPKTRYNISLAQRKGVEIRVGNEADFENFFLLLQKTARRQHIRLHPKTHYQSLLRSSGEIQTELIFAWQKNIPLAAYLMLYYQNVATYLHGGTNYEMRSMMGPHLLHWSTIVAAKQRGCQWYDFYGIAPSSASQNHPLAGVTRYKLGFGGQRRSYPGAYDVVFDSRAYRWYSRARTFWRILRRWI